MGISRFKAGGIAVGLLSVITVAACGGGSSSSSSSGAVAASQVLKFPIFADPATLDPGIETHEVDSELAQNLFDNLWIFDNNLKIVPDIASEVPTQSNGGISTDGLTYTIHLRHDVTFSNGDKLTSKDVLYSWNRSAALKGGYSSNLAAIVGINDVAAAAGKKPKKGSAASSILAFQQNIETHLASGDPAFMMKGLTAPDPYTVKVVLSATCGWCLAAWTLQATTGSIVDENAIKADPVDWWQKPGEEVGTGAYALSAYTPKQSITFKKVANWWGSPKPTLSEIDIDIKDPSTQPTALAAWEQGSYDIDGYGGYSNLPISDVLRIKGSSSESSQLHLVAKGRDTWVTPQIGDAATGGPFLGDSATAKGLRLAFDLAIDRTSLASTVCHNVICAPMTGGLIAKGLLGYLGDNADPLAKYDPTRAKQLLQQYDPAGKLTANLKYSYNQGTPNDDVATFLQGQWQQHLGVNVTLNPNPDVGDFINKRNAYQYVLARDGWQFDYNHPQDWYDNLYGTAGVSNGSNSSGWGDNGASGTGASDPQPQYDTLLAKADGTPDVQQALPIYAQLAQMLQNDVAYIPLYQTVGQFLIHSYVQGAGSTTQADYYWDAIKLLSH